MQKWKYKIEMVPSQHFTEATFNIWGEEGWEFVQAVEWGNTLFRCVFKQPVKATRKKDVLLG